MRPLHSTTAFALTIKLFGTEWWNDIPRGMRKTVLVAHKPVCLEQGKRRYASLERPSATRGNVHAGGIRVDQA